MNDEPQTIQQPRGQKKKYPKKNGRATELEACQRGVSEKALKRFWSKVHKTDTCWLWTAGRFRAGYGEFGLNRASLRAHRFSYLLKHGKPAEPMCLHTCDVRACVNPDHLFEGTNADNGRDMAMKGRHPHAKLNPSLVIELRALHDNGVGFTKLAAKYNLGVSTVRHAYYRESFAYVP